MTDFTGGNRLHSQICVITGSGSGMGLAAARKMAETHYVIMCGRTVSKLQRAADELKACGGECETYACDVADRSSVHSLALHAQSLECVYGNIQCVINAAGMSPHMGDAEKIMETNAAGTVNVNTEFASVMGAGSCILDVSSMSAYLVPKIIFPRAAYRLSFAPGDMFMKKMMNRVRFFPAKLRSDIAYGISKDFVIWYARQSALLYGKSGIRVVCVSPGNFETPMGKLEEAEAEKYMKHAALPRFGKPEEIAYLFSTIVDSRNSYLTGVDILCDGGLIASGVTPFSR